MRIRYAMYFPFKTMTSGQRLMRVEEADNAKYRLKMYSDEVKLSCYASFHVEDDDDHGDQWQVGRCKTRGPCLYETHI